MARPLRICFPGAWYHVMNRGLEKRNIFLTNKHRLIFLALLQEIHTKYDVKIHAYCLMNNHYHLLIQTPMSNISRAMRHLNGIYTQRFNKSVSRDGPLFRGRFKSILVDQDNYLLQLTRYIHLNPTEANIVKSPEEFRWSSYQFYINSDKMNKKPDWLTVDDTLSFFGDDSPANKYGEFVESGLDQDTRSFYQEEKTDPIFGSKAFRKLINELYIKNHTVIDMPDAKRIEKKLTADDIIKTVSAYYQQTLLLINNKSKRNEPRSISIYLSNELTDCSRQQIALLFGVTTENNVSQICSRLKKKMLCETKLASKVSKIKALIADGFVTIRT